MSKMYKLKNREHRRTDNGKLLIGKLRFEIKENVSSRKFQLLESPIGNSVSVLRYLAIFQSIHLQHLKFEAEGRVEDPRAKNPA